MNAPLTTPLLPEVQRAIAGGGTCTGERGVGLHQMELLRAEAGEEALALMRALKRALDPHDILNPGKIVTIC